MSLLACALCAAVAAAGTVTVDPGHNGGNAAHPEAINRLVPAGGFRKACDTVGAQTSDGRLTEHAFTWDVARRLQAALAARGATVRLTRPDDAGVGPCVDRRAALGAGSDVAISLHADGGPPSGRGFHVIRATRANAAHPATLRPSLRLARLVRARLDAIGLRRSTYAGRAGLDARADLGGLNLSPVPKVLVELGNLRNAADARALKRPGHRAAIARALARALAAF